MVVYKAHRGERNQVVAQRLDRQRMSIRDSGNDELDAADGAGETDVLDCGAGADDIGRLEAADSASGCENLQLAP